MPYARAPGAVACAVAAAALLASCGGESPPKRPPPPAKAGGGTRVAMRSIAFVPATATVKVGATVTWTNDDSVDHNVTATSGARFKSPAFGRNGSASFTPKKAGRIRYVCTLHPGMKGTLVVTR
jgi:plastocyanin